jgi:hypothetical protein
MIFLLVYFQDDLRFFIYFDDGEVEYDADSAEEKNKVHLIYHYYIRHFIIILICLGDRYFCAALSADILKAVLDVELFMR